MHCYYHCYFTLVEKLKLDKEIVGDVVSKAKGKLGNFAFHKLSRAQRSCAKRAEVGVGGRILMQHLPQHLLGLSSFATSPCSLSISWSRHLGNDCSYFSNRRADFLPHLDRFRRVFRNENLIWFIICSNDNCNFLLYISNVFCDLSSSYICIIKAH